MNTKMQGRSHWESRLVGLSIGVILLGVLGAIFLLSWTDFSPTTGSDSSSDIVASSIALVGTMITAMVTLMGLLLKRSFDARNLVMKTEAEHRMRLETSIRAVELFTDASGEKSANEGETSASKRASALFVLTNLGQLDFALRLLGPLWKQNKVEVPHAIWVLDKALGADSPATQHLAASLLETYAKKLPEEGDLRWPPTLDPRWNPHLYEPARIMLFSARMKALLSKPHAWWKDETINSYVIALLDVMVKESSRQLLAASIVTLGVLLDYYPKQYAILLPKRRIDIDNLRKQLKKYEKASENLSNDRDRRSVDNLKKWVHTPSSA